jgi:ribose transport system permease protein
VSLKGGRGDVFGVMVGAAIMGVIRNGLLIMNISAYYQTTIIGAVVIAVASFDAIRSRR